MINGLEGQALNHKTDFFGEDNLPLSPQAGYPKVELVDHDGLTISATVAAPDDKKIGCWFIMLPVPMLGLERPTEYKLKWRFLTQDNERYSLVETVLIAPKKDRRDTDVVLLTTDTLCRINIPISVDTSIHDQTIRIFNDNDLIQTLYLADCKVDAGDTKTMVEFESASLTPAMKSRLTIVDVQYRDRYEQFVYNIWCVTPQITKAANQTIAFLLDKSNVGNIISALEWTYSDMMGYLENGLNFFNAITGERMYTTTFTGLNMQGPLLFAWVICSAYWAVQAQIVAEGSLAFDFSGQSINLSVNRMEAWENLKGWLEKQIDDIVKPLKQQLAAQNILGGDGSVGTTQMQNPQNVGMVGLTNAVTTSVWYNGFGGCRQGYRR